MRFSTHLLAVVLSATAAVAAPISFYDWSITNFSAGADFASFQISGPTGEFDDIPIPAFNFTAPCKVQGSVGASADCSSLIENNTDGRTFKLSIVSVDGGTATASGTFGFTSGGTSYSVIAGQLLRDPQSPDQDSTSFSVDGEKLTN
ncbi:hypothetical protein LX32DRAFT_689536 [Colletotrichum zoysiae]|uniref:Uncharacterized protein n=1 Tax=Colletotrichum zoysiae TaxID=1216348 RepID=A0AAD9M6X5_9PEZI|nr:hypothetical protein LX32DRAFT_689536 [Colletotrichum zoysiae]